MLGCCSWSKSPTYQVSPRVSDETNIRLIVDVIYHCKQNQYDLAKAKLSTPSDGAIKAVMWDQSFLADLEALGIKQSGPHTVYSIHQGLTALINAKCQEEAPPIQVSMHPNAVVVAPVRSQPVATRPEQLRSIIAENRTDHRAQIDEIRDDAVKQFEEAGLYNQLNDSALSHQVAVAKEEVEIAKRKREMAQIHADNMKAKQAQLATLRQQRETLDACDRLNITPDELRLQKELDAMRIELGKIRR